MTAPAGPTPIELSVVIPTHRRPQLLARCIRSLVAQDPASGVELLVVVDGADPQTEQMLASLSTPFPLRVIVQEHARAGRRPKPGCAGGGRASPPLPRRRRRCRAGPCWLRIWLLYEPTNAPSGSGRIDKMLPRRAPRWLRSRQAAWRSHYDRLAAGREPRFTDCYGGNVSLSRTAFLDCGGFAVDLSPEEDIELGYRLAQAGLRFVYLDDAVVREEDRDDLRRYVDIARARGRVGVKLYERTPRSCPTSAWAAHTSSRAMGRPSAGLHGRAHSPDRARTAGRLAPTRRPGLPVVRLPVRVRLLVGRPRDRRRRHVAETAAGHGDPHVPRDRSWGGAGRAGTSSRPRSFERQLDWLRRRRYNGDRPRRLRPSPGSSTACRRRSRSC